MEPLILLSPLPPTPPPHPITPGREIHFGNTLQIKRKTGVRQIDILHSKNISFLTTLLHLDNYFSRLLPFYFSITKHLFFI